MWCQCLSLASNNIKWSPYTLLFAIFPENAIYNLPCILKVQCVPGCECDGREAYVQANPVLAKMMISGVFYSLVDWIAQVPMGHLLITTTISMRHCPTKTSSILNVWPLKSL